MDINNRNEGKDFHKFLENLSEEEIQRGNAIELERARKDYEEFSKAFANDRCSTCGKSFKTFSTSSPCLHWLLKPKGFKTKHLPQVAESFGLLRLQAYLRWVASQEAFGRNINDLDGSDSVKPLINETIKWRHLEWSIHCSESDFAGHGKSSVSLQPHFHMQIRIDGRQYIKYNAFHLPLSNDDIFHLEAVRQPNSKISRIPVAGVGMRDLLNIDPELIVNHLEGEPDESEAMLNVNTIVMAEPGKEIDSNKLADLLVEARETGGSFAKAVRQLPNAVVKTTISPGEGVAKKAERKGVRGKKNEQL